MRGYGEKIARNFRLSHLHNWISKYAGILSHLIRAKTLHRSFTFAKQKMLSTFWASCLHVKKNTGQKFVQKLLFYSRGEEIKASLLAILSMVVFWALIWPFMHEISKNKHSFEAIIRVLGCKIFGSIYRCAQMHSPKASSHSGFTLSGKVETAQTTVWPKKWHWIEKLAWIWLKRKVQYLHTTFAWWTEYRFHAYN